MSKKKQLPKAPIKKEVPVRSEAEKKPIKGIIIAAAAVILVAAIVLTAVFVVKPAIDKKTETTTNANNQYTLPGSGGYEYVDYKGTKMAKELVDILNQAEIDRDNACKKHGIALELGDIKISHPEFISYYYDQYSNQKQEIEYSIQKTGTNRTGYVPEKMPDEQQCLNKGYTWAEDFTRKAISAITENYQGFNKAIEAGIELTDSDVDFILAQCDLLETASRFQQKSIEELLEAIYGEDYTASMFKAREIMLVYKQKYQSYAKQKLADGYSEAELKEKLDEDTNAYTLIVGRVYLIEGDFDAVEVSKISNEEEFIAYAQKNNPVENYDAEVVTRCNYVNRNAISDTFGNEVAEWMFSSERVPGEIGFVQGSAFRYLVYIEKLPYFNTSKKIMAYDVEYDENITQEDAQKTFEDTQAIYDEWKNSEATAESFEEMCYAVTDMPVRDVMAGDYYYVFNDWILDESRKPGDTVLLDSDVGCSILYFVQDNPEDYDWKNNIRTDMSEADYKAAYEEDVEKNYEENRNTVVINKAYKTVNITIARKLAEEAKEE